MNAAAERFTASFSKAVHDLAAAMEDESSSLDAFVQDLTSSQGRLRAFILASLGNYADTADVLQRTNLVLWKKASEFRPGSEFLPWAFATARYEVLAFVRDSKRDRHVFTEEVGTLMLDMAADEALYADTRRESLRICLEKLPPRNRELLWLRYGDEQSIRQIATTLQRSDDAVKSLFLRIRKTLERCVEANFKRV